MESQVFVVLADLINAARRLDGTNILDYQVELFVTDSHNRRTQFIVDSRDAVGVVQISDEVDFTVGGITQVTFEDYYGVSKKSDDKDGD